MKKFISILATAMLLLSATTVMAADTYKDKVLTFDAVDTKVTFNIEGEYTKIDDEAVIKFDRPVTFNFEGNADNGMICDIVLSKYDNAEIAYDVAEDFMSSVIMYLEGDFYETTLQEGSYLLVLSTKEEQGSAVVILVGEPKVVPVVNEITQSKLPAGAQISEWAVSEVLEAYESGLITMEIYSGNTYNRNITRGEFARVMAEFLKQSGINYDKYVADFNANPAYKFTDTDNDMAIEFVSSCGIINGISETEFNPSGELTREQAAAMLARTVTYLGVPVMVENVAAFADEGEFSDWAKDSIYTIAGIRDKKNNLAVMGGVGNNMFSANTGYTVEQALMAAKRLLSALSI